MIYFHTAPFPEGFPPPIPATIDLASDPLHFNLNNITLDALPTVTNEEQSSLPSSVLIEAELLAEFLNHVPPATIPDQISWPTGHASNGSPLHVESDTSDLQTTFKSIYPASAAGVDFNHPVVLSMP